MVATSEPSACLLRSSDWKAALDFVGEMVDTTGDGDDADGFARRGVDRLGRIVASELTTLSLCDLRTGRRHVMGAPPGVIGHNARASFDQHFHEHPLLRHHAVERGLHVQRISDFLTLASFRRTALYCDYYRSIGISHALALPVQVNDAWLVSFVLNRAGRDFSDRERALLDQVRPALARLFRRTRLLDRARQAWLIEDGAARAAPALPQLHGISLREHEVLRWVAAGKTDRDIAAILDISHRTVHKHLQSVYCKLGVETRTAAVMRVIAPH